MLKKIKNKLKNKKKKQKIDYSAYNKGIISWYAPEFLQYEKGIFWKISALVILFAIIVLGIIYNAWTFSLVVLTLSAVYYLSHREHPRVVKVTISDVGIKVAERHYPYSQIKGYWLVYHPPYIKKLNIRVQGKILLDIPILIHEQDPAFIQQILNRRITEIKGKTEPLSESILRLLKI
ncbi:hypothetical protein ACFL21_03760 [Patescibacteria group bacterium]